MPLAQKRMHNVDKRNTVVVLTLAAVFWFFFQISKHDLAFARANPFAEDPYDAVGSFAVQFVIFMAVLSVLRAFRPYPPDVVLKAQQRILVRGQFMAIVAVIVTMGGDAVAMVRHPAMWVQSLPGRHLAMLIGSMLLGAGAAGWFVFRSARHFSLLPSHPQFTRSWVARSVMTSAAVVLILAIYPEGLRQSTSGELFTVLIGAILLFVAVKVLATAILPLDACHSPDLMDDLDLLYRVIWSRTIFLHPVYGLLRKCLLLQPIQTLVKCLNPRKHPWKFTLVIGMVAGIFLLVEEVRGSSGSLYLPRLLVVSAVYIGLESAAVLIGYALLSKPLKLFGTTRGG